MARDDARIRSTTILAVRRDGRVALAGDGCWWKNWRSNRKNRVNRIYV